MPRVDRLNSLTDAQLLRTRPCDLNLQIDDSPLQPAIAQLHRELCDRDLRLRPHVWLSDEWFTPDGVPGIAAPFYLAHPRLRELERRQMLDVEGGDHPACMRILRHEAGHAIDNAFKLHARTRYRELFGSWHAPYPESYQPRPNTKRHVIHLEMNYAQAHPAEDFAETFAVWLDPASNWCAQYAGWPAMQKLLYVDGLMRRLAHQSPLVRSRRKTHTMRTLRHTLAEHYARRRRSAFIAVPPVRDHDLHRIFGPAPTRPHRQRVKKNAVRSARNLSRQVRKISPAWRDAASVVEAHRVHLRTAVARWTGASSLMIDRMIADMVQRLRTLGLPGRRSERDVVSELTVMLTASTISFVHDRKHRVVL